MPFRILKRFLRHHPLLLLIITALVYEGLVAAPAWAQNDHGINILRFGAYPNDEVDDTEAIQNAIEKAEADDSPLASRTIFIPPGSYLVRGVVISKGNITLRGAGAKVSILKHRGEARPIVHLRGATFTTLIGLGLEGSSTSSYGIYAEDTGATLGTKGSPTWRGTLHDVSVSKVMGNPGIGWANNDRAHSWQVTNSMFRENRIGIRLVRRCQNTVIAMSSIIFNIDQQVIFGDGYNIIRGLSIRDSQIEGTDTGTTELIRVDGVAPLHLAALYLESHRGTGAMDLQTVNQPSSIAIDGVYSNGGSQSQIKQSLLFNTETNLTLKNGQFLGTEQVIKIGTLEKSDGQTAQRACRIEVTGSRGPGLKDGWQVTQRGDSWNDGLSLSYAGHNWDIVVGRAGELWFGHNGKTAATLLPTGELKKP